MVRTDCLTDADLNAYQLGELSGGAWESVAAHLGACPDCLARLERLPTAADPVLAALRQMPARPAPDDPACRRALDQLAAPAAVAEAERVEPGQHLREYRLLEKLGEGGMGTVFTALHTRLDKVVAVKVLKRGRDPEAVARFDREMRAAGRFRHPHIVQATDAGEADGVPFLVMEYVPGCDLARLVKRRGPLRPADACEAIRQAAEGLQHAHEAGLVHRDIKPSNLVLAPDGCVKVLDLGLALLRDDPAPPAIDAAAESWRDGDTLTSASRVVGTRDYMAPEQRHCSHGVDARADVYGLGSTLVYLFTGRPPAPGVPARIAGVPTALAELTGRLLAEQPEDRPASAAAVARALRRFNAGHDLPALAAGSAARPRRRLAGRAAAAAGLLLAAAGAAALLRHDPPSADDQAEPVAAAAPAPVVASPPPAPTPPLGELGLTEEVSRRLRQTWAVYLGRSVVEHNTLGMELCFVPPGRLLLQSSYLATVSRPYYLGACEVTVGQFRAFVMATGYVTWAESSGRGGELLTFFPRGKDLRPEYTWRAPGFPIGDDHPVVQVSWHDAEAFCRWLSRREGKTYRLPTAAEWKWAGYAARPRGEANRVLRATAVYCRDEDHPFTVPQPVGGRPPNPWGLRDMLGNVMEWGADWHGPTPQGPFTDPCGPAEGTKKLLLGGHYGFALRPLLVNNTMISDPDAASSYVGFRVLREP